jgi:Flp pilus assembly protein TadD
VKNGFVVALCLGVMAVVGLSGSAARAADTKPADKSSAKSGAVDTLAMLEHAVAKDSSKFDNLYKLGSMYLDRDRVDEAQKVLSKAHQLKPKDVPTIVNLGAAYDALGKSGEAQKQYRSALQLAPGDSVATCRLASSLYAGGQYQEAMDMLRDLIAKRPNAHCAYFTLGVAFADAGIYKDAVRMWKKVVELAPTSPEAISAKESIDVLERVIQGK